MLSGMLELTVYQYSPTDRKEWFWPQDLKRIYRGSGDEQNFTVIHVPVLGNTRLLVRESLSDVLKLIGLTR